MSTADAGEGDDSGDETQERDRYLVETLLAGAGSTEVPDRSKTLHDDRLRQENEQSRRLFQWALWGVSGQLVIADIVFIVYVIVTWSKGQDVPSVVISSWLAATVVEVVGIMAIIARSLFPSDPDR